MSILREVWKYSIDCTIWGGGVGKDSISVRPSQLDGFLTEIQFKKAELQF